MVSYEVYVKIGIFLFIFRAIVVYMVKIVINLSTDNKRNMLIITRSSESFLSATNCYVETKVLIAPSKMYQLLRQRCIFLCTHKIGESCARNSVTKPGNSLTIAFVCGCVCIWKTKNYCISCGKVIFAQSLPSSMCSQETCEPFSLPRTFLMLK